MKAEDFMLSGGSTSMGLYHEQTIEIRTLESCLMLKAVVLRSLRRNVQAGGWKLELPHIYGQVLAHGARARAALSWRLVSPWSALGLPPLNSNPHGVWQCASATLPIR